MFTLLCFSAGCCIATSPSARLDIFEKQEQLSETRTTSRGADINGVIVKMPSDSTSRLCLPYAAALL
ncbi:hypothetical protein [Rhizobium oryziradicis]|uniref:hypothetical protein n=1 Tax=Rhizobium oryziradicis TaxID=1867956 RepID=UPI000AF5B4D1|nr:hypothetical protein [Rhizobium oryziradicis]